MTHDETIRLKKYLALKDLIMRQRAHIAANADAPAKERAIWAEELTMMLDELDELKG